MSEPKYAHRFPPCPMYDVEGLESWLEDQARQGLFLNKAGLFFGFAEFEKRDPKPMRYRLQPLPKKKALQDRCPADAALELAEDYGWDYLCNFGEFAIYGCEDPQARELDTDPHVQAMAIRQLYRRKRNSAFFTILLELIFAILLLELGPISYTLDCRRYYISFYLVLMLVYPGVARQELRQLKELLNKLSLGEPLSRSKDWKSGRWQHRLSALVAVLTYVMLIAFSFSSRVSWAAGRWEPIADYPDPIPFARMEDLADGTFVADGVFSYEDNHIAARSTLLASRQINLRQMGHVTKDGQTVLSGALYVDYYELRTEWLAKQLFREHCRKDRSAKHYQELALSPLSTDQEFAYANTRPVLLLQEGTRVLKVQFSQYSKETLMEPDQWAAIFAESLSTGSAVP